MSDSLWDAFVARHHFEQDGGDPHFVEAIELLLGVTFGA